VANSPCRDRLRGSKLLVVITDNGYIHKGDRVQVLGIGSGRVIAVINGALYRVRYDRPDPLGNPSGDHLIDVLRRTR